MRIKVQVENKWGEVWRYTHVATKVDHGGRLYVVVLEGKGHSLERVFE